ncbi:GNAT family N-acetyltransferase [uncultured Maribacter sp.]|uniref:GNAT family N-acetyltransferase n=1 Tax=uncultured Maribacter sp. TaxID=431308 RepID=UPI0026258229|nr:GNAT family N-acetyltransferase [uncultured Maribacter sp.]
MIKKIKKSDIKELNHLPPQEWQIDYETFLKEFIDEDFFHAFIQIQDNKIVGTGNILLKGKVGWLGNIIVDKNCRGKGLGYEMTKFLVDFLDKKGCETQLLIATELGESVYKKLGFKKLTEYQSFDSTVDNDFNLSDSIQKLELSDLKNVYKLDLETNMEDRAHLIDKFYNNGFGFFNDDNQLLGFYLPEFGRGLVISKNKQAGIELLKLKHSKKGKRTLLPIENQSGIQLLEEMGLNEGEKSARMVLGEVNKWVPNNIYSYGSGYCG